MLNAISWYHSGTSRLVVIFRFLFQYGHKKTNPELSHLETALQKSYQEIAFKIYMYLNRKIPTRATGLLIG